jgi:hypothetical protein
VEPRRYGRQKLDPHRDAEPELEANRGRKLHREELPWAKLIAFVVVSVLIKFPGD